MKDRFSIVEKEGINCLDEVADQDSQSSPVHIGDGSHGNAQDSVDEVGDGYYQPPLRIRQPDEINCVHDGEPRYQAHANRNDALPYHHYLKCLVIQDRREEFPCDLFYG